MAEIEAFNLVKTFGALRAVDGLSFRVERGETYGLLGPNGAGKTTTMRMLAGLSPITAGTLRLAGIDVAANPRGVREQLGVVTQSDGLDDELTAVQNLEVFGFLVGLSRREAKRRAREVLEFFAGLEGLIGPPKMLDGSLSMQALGLMPFAVALHLPVLYTQTNTVAILELSGGFQFLRRLVSTVTPACVWGGVYGKMMS